jgi:glutamine amidotransferase
VGLIDSGGSNIGSVQYALERLGVNAPLTRDAALIQSAERVILPGVGAAAPAMAKLREAGLVELIRSLAQPLLGVCVGMQILRMCLLNYAAWFIRCLIKRRSGGCPAPGRWGRRWK